MLLDLLEAKPQWNLATAAVSTVASLKLCALRTLVCPVTTDDPNTINIFVCQRDPVKTCLCSRSGEMFMKLKKKSFYCLVNYIYTWNIHIYPFITVQMLT